MGGQATAVLILGNVRTRTRLVEVGGIAGLAYLAMTVATELYSGQTWQLIAWDAGRGLLWGLLAGFLVSGLLPLVEYCFTIVTDVSLVELADGSHPLLQELVRRAPGTYTHSMTVATLAEPAAEAIGANPLLTRVGSYFHDIGKMLKPHYFIENQTGENRHDALEPALSTLIIIGHVKDGVALAEQYRLPRPIIDFIQQHHGTTLVEYFYREALRQQEGLGNAPPRRRRPAAPAGADVPLSRPQAADARERHRHAGRRRGEFQPGAVQPDAGQPAEAGARHADETAAGRPVRGERLDADGAAHRRGEPVQGADRLVPLAHQVPGGGAEEGVVTPSAADFVEM